MKRRDLLEYERYPCKCGECEDCLDRMREEDDPDDEPDEPRENEALAWGGMDGYRDSKY